jgi:hypothetical protein
MPCPPKNPRRVEHMHRAAFAADVAARFAVKLSHHGFGRNAFDHRLNVVAVSGNHVIVFRAPSSRRRDRFLTDIKMAKAADFSDAVNFGAFLLEISAENHLVKHFFQKFRARFLIEFFW